MTSKSLRAFVLDDHEIVRRGVIDLLEANGWEVVGEAATAAETVRRVPILLPDIALLDARLPDGNGIEVCRAIRSAAPSVKCIILTSFDDDRAMLEAVLGGASAFVLKNVRATKLLETIGRVAAGEKLLEDAKADALRRRMQDTRVTPLSSLTAQEHKVLILVAAGLTNRLIARKLGLSEQTVKNYFTKVLAKLGLQSRTQAALAVERLQADGGNSLRPQQDSEDL